MTSPAYPESAAQRRLARTVHAGFVVILVTASVWYVVWRGAVGPALPTLGAAALFGALYLAGAIGPSWPGRSRRVWLLAVVVAWTVLTLAVSPFSWCAVPLFFLVQRELPLRRAIPVVVWLGAVAGLVPEFHARVAWDPSPLLAPVVIAVMSTILYHQLQTLTRSERAAGVLQERIRLSQEIRDTLAQGLSSMHLLLNAADQQWRSAPEEARAHVRRAADTARENLAGARRFVRDLAPPELDGNSLPDALHRLCENTAGVPVKFVVAGDVCQLGVDVEVALLRVAQGALANVVQHAKARTAVATLSYLDDAVTLDVCDDGVGFEPAAPPVTPDRGFGLPAIRHRSETLGGAATVESAPGDGTAVAVSLPVGGGS